MTFYHIKENEDYSDSAHRWLLKRDQFLIGELYTTKKEAKEIVTALQNYADLMKMRDGIDI